MRKIFRARYFFLALVVLVVGSFAEFAYRTNYVCALGDHIILSDADAIKQAQMRIIRAGYYDPHGVPGYIDVRPGIADFSQANCCEVKRTVTAAGIIVWEVGLEGKTFEPKPRHVSALMRLSNCGEVFDEESYISAKPIR